MKLDKKILEEKIRQYRKTKSCSESTLIGLCETADADITKEEMIKLGWVNQSKRTKAIYLQKEFWLREENVKKGKPKYCVI